MTSAVYYNAKPINSVPHTKHKNSGFTLLELLVALSVFALLAIMAYTGLQNVLDTAAHVQASAQKTTRLQLVFSRLEQDLTQIVQRPLRDAFGDEQSAVQGHVQGIVLTRTGWQNPLQRRRSHLQRVAWLLQDNGLYRRYWTVLDGAQEGDGLEAKMLEKLENIEFRFLDDQAHWHNEWPPYTPSGTTAEVRLKAVELKLTLESWGELRRLWAVVM